MMLNMKILLVLAVIENQAFCNNDNSVDNNDIADGDKPCKKNTNFHKLIMMVAVSDSPARLINPNNVIFKEVNSTKTDGSWGNRIGFVRRVQIITFQPPKPRTTTRRPRPKNQKRSHISLEHDADSAKDSERIKRHLKKQAIRDRKSARKSNPENDLVDEMTPTVQRLFKRKANRNKRNTESDIVVRPTPTNFGLLIFAKVTPRTIKLPAPKSTTRRPRPK